MTSQLVTPELPARPNPYSGVGNGWNISLTVPGYGVWRRNPSQVSITYTVYNQAGSDYHITINSSYLDKPANPTPMAALGTHITSNDAIGDKTVHWPNLVALSVAQQNWLDYYNGAGEFDALIAAFEAQMRLRATNVKLSRDYDAALIEYGKQHLAVAAQARKAKVGFEEDLSEWVDACPPDAYLAAFQEKTDSYFLDLNRGMVVLLNPKPLLVRTGGGLDQGFANMCGEVLGGKAAPLTAGKWGRILDGLVLLRIRDKERAMRRSDFDACQPVEGLLSLEQVVEQAVTAWTKAVVSSKAYTKIAADKTLMNVTGPDSAPFHLKTLDLLDMGALTRFGISAAKTKTAELPLFADLAGVYEAPCVAALQAKLPPAVRISGDGKMGVYIVPELLVEGWSRELQKASSVDPAALAEALVKKGAGCQLFAENLVVDDRADMTVYLQGGLDGSGSAFYVGPKDAVAPGVTASETDPLDLKDNARGVKAYFGGGLSSTFVASSPDSAFVVCGIDRKPLTPLIFVGRGKLPSLDLTKAREAYASIQREKRRAQAAEAEKVKAAAMVEAAMYANAWKIIEPQLRSSRSAELWLYVMPQGALVAVGRSDETAFNKVKAADGTLVETIEVKKQDKKRKGAQFFHRHLEFAYTQRGSIDWVTGLAKYIADNKPDLPSGAKGYFVTLKK